MIGIIDKKFKTQWAPSPPAAIGNDYNILHCSFDWFNGQLTLTIGMVPKIP